MSIYPDSPRELYRDIKRKLEDPVSFVPLETAVTLHPCGHVLNKDTVEDICLNGNGQCPFDRIRIKELIPSFIIRELAKDFFLSAKFNKQAKFHLLDFPLSSEARTLHLLQKLLLLLDNSEIQQNNSLVNIFQQKIKELYKSQEEAPLSSSDRIFYRCIQDLLNKTGKIRPIVAEQLIAESPSPSSSAPIGFSYSPPELVPFSAFDDELTSPSVVSKSASTASLSAVAIPAVDLGKADWERYFGDIRGEPFLQGCPPLIRNFLSDTTINANGQYGLGYALCRAVLNDWLDAVKEIISCNRVSEINVNGEHSLGYALCLATFENHLEIVKEIIKCKRFSEINVNGQDSRDSLDNLMTVFLIDNNYSLAYALCLATFWARLEIVREIINCKLFSEINANGQFGLGDALYAAAYRGWSAIVGEIINCERFSEINANGQFGLGDALCQAATADHFEVAREIINCERFSEINANEQYGLGHALFTAVSKKACKVVETIMNCKRFSEINVKGWCGLSSISIQADLMQLNKISRKIKKKLRMK